MNFMWAWGLLVVVCEVGVGEPNNVYVADGGASSRGNQMGPLPGPVVGGEYPGPIYEAQIPPLPNLPPAAIAAWEKFETEAMTSSERVQEALMAGLPASPVPSILDGIPWLYRDYIGQTYGGDRVLQCDRNKTYVVPSQDSLDAYKGEYECIYARGQSPTRGPIGPWLGKVHEVVNSNLVNVIANTFWTGKMGFKTQCRGSGTEFTMLFNIVLSGARAPALMYIGTLTEPLAPGEYSDGKKSLFLDYSIDWSKLCPSDPNFQYNINWGIINNVWPVRQVVDIVRKVGESPDGGHIMLGKSLYRDSQAWPAHKDTTVGWWSVVSYDAGAFEPHFDPVLKPLEEDIVYRQPGTVATVAALLPFDNYPENPIQALATTQQDTVRNFFGLPPLSPYGKSILNVSPSPQKPTPSPSPIPNPPPTIYKGGRVQF